MSEFNVNLERERELEELKNRIDSAFQNRKLEEDITYPDEAQEKVIKRSYKKSDVDLAKHVRERVDLSSMGRKEEDPVIDLPYIPQKNEALVDHAHDYPALLRAANEKIFNYANAQENEDGKQEAVAKMLKHEYEHHVPGLGEEGLKIKYGVKFNEDKKAGTVSWQPFITLVGQAKKSVLERIFRAPAELSKGDEEMTK
ncbi:MAG: hypothetical protein AAB856_01790 [Patescibacteria group bacterium]